MQEINIKFNSIKAYLNSPVVFVIGFVFYINTLYIPNDYYFIEYILSNYIRTVGISIMIIWLAINQTNILIKSLEMPPLKYIGTISYGVYMYQGLFLATGPSRDPAQSWPLGQDIGIFLLIIAAPFSYHYFEKPFLKLKDRFH